MHVWLTSETWEGDALLESKEQIVFLLSVEYFMDVSVHHHRHCRLLCTAFQESLLCLYQPRHLPFSMWLTRQNALQQSAGSNSELIILRSVLCMEQRRSHTALNSITLLLVKFSVQDDCQRSWLTLKSDIHLWSSATNWRWGGFFFSLIYSGHIFFKYHVNWIIPFLVRWQKLLIQR